MGEKDALQKGYRAKNSEATCFAVHSSVLVQNGEVHDGGSGKSTKNMVGVEEQKNTIYPLDSFVELYITEDPRLGLLLTQEQKDELKRTGTKTLMDHAQEIGKKYGDKKSSDYIADAVQREKIIADELATLVVSVYGSYSDEALKAIAEGGDARNEEKKRANNTSSDHAYLAKMGKGDLVCLEQAAIMSVLLHTAGVPNDLVAAHSTEVRPIKDNQSELGKLHEEATLAGEWQKYHPADETLQTLDERNNALMDAVLKKIKEYAKKEQHAPIDAALQDKNAPLTRLGNMSEDLAGLVAIGMQAGGVKDLNIDVIADKLPKPPMLYRRDSNHEVSYHAFLMTENNTLIEATDMGIEPSVCEPIINGVTTNGIVFFGQGAITQRGKLGTIYGGHNGNGNPTEKEIEQFQDYSIERYNDGVLQKVKPLKLEKDAGGKPPNVSMHDQIKSEGLLLQQQGIAWNGKESPPPTVSNLAQYITIKTLEGRA